MPKRNLTPPKTFEDALQELEQILAEIESGEMGLEDSLAKYERGNLLIRHCRAVLSSAEKQIELLSKAPDGSIRSEPIETPGGEIEDASGDNQESQQDEQGA